MIQTIKKITTLCLCCVAFACSDAFINEKIDVSEYTDITFLISPNWGTTNYTIQYAGVSNAQYHIERIPKWMTIHDATGQFVGGQTTIQCSASAVDAFTETGIYSDYIIMNIDGRGKSVIPFAYIVEGNPIISIDSLNIVLDYDAYYNPGQTFYIKNSGDGYLLWQIKEQPEWLTVNVYNAIEHYVPNLLKRSDLTAISIRHITSILPDDPNGKIVIVSNDRKNPEIIINVKLNLGDPRLHCEGLLDFGRKTTQLSFIVSNDGTGTLNWTLEGLPEWLTATTTSGALKQYNTNYLTFTCDRARMPAGKQTLSLSLKTNDQQNPVYSIDVTAYNYQPKPENIRQIDGNITDIYMDKINDRLYIVTSQPNKLLLYNMSSRTIDREMPLDKAPQCLSVSQNGDRAVVGHNKMISCINLNSFTVFRKFDVDYNVFGIEWGDGDWVCYTADNGDGFSDLRWRNIVTDEKHINTEQNGELYDKTIVKRIPNNGHIIATRLALSPSGITMFNPSTHLFTNYYHIDIGKFWFSNNGEYMFTANNNIYRVASLLTGTSSFDINSIGKFYYNSNQPAPYTINWVDQNTNTNNVWVLAPDAYDSWSGPREIIKYNGNDYTLIDTYYYDEIGSVTVNGATVQYPAQAQYIFTNRAETELIVVRNINEYSGITPSASNTLPFAWSIEHIQP